MSRLSDRGRTCTIAVAGSDWPERLERTPTEATPRGARVRFVIDDALVRYLRVIWPHGISNDAEREAFVRHRHREAFGADGGAIAWDRDAIDEPALTVAIPGELVEALRELCVARRLRMISLRPALVDAFNRHRRALSGPAGALARYGQGRCTLAIWQRGLWQAVRGGACGPGDTVIPSALLRQVLAGCNPIPAAGTLYVLGMGAAPAMPPLPEGWGVKWLPEAVA